MNLTLNLKSNKSRPRYFLLCCVVLCRSNQLASIKTIYLLHSTQFITKTFTTASSSISINGLDSNDTSAPSSSSDPTIKTKNINPFPFPTAFAAPTETVEYEPYDATLAARVTALYAQLESLTTTVAQLRRDAPKRAAETYADALAKMLEEDEKEEAEADSKVQVEARAAMERTIVVEPSTSSSSSSLLREPSRKKRRSGRKSQDTGPGATHTEMGDTETAAAAAAEENHGPAWKLDVPFGARNEMEKWHNGEMAEVYSDTLRILLRLQGEVLERDGQEESEDSSGKGLATTIGKAERAGRAAEVVQNM
jgi:kinetochor protein Mis14/NSL1